MPRGLGKTVAAVVLEHGAEADVEVLGPSPHRLVDGLGLVAQLDRVDPERDPLNLVKRPFEQVNGGTGGVVLEAASEHPPRVQAGGAEGEHAVARPGRPCVGDGVDEEEARFRLVRARGEVEESHAGGGEPLRRHSPLAIVTGSDGAQVPIDRRRTDGEQFGTDLTAVSPATRHERTVALRRVEQSRHRRGQILPALVAGPFPHRDQQRAGLRGVLGAPRLRSDTPRRIRRRCAGPGSNGELGQTATGMVPRPSGDDHDLVEDPPLVLLPRRGIEVEVIVDDQLRIRIRVD